MSSHDSKAALVTGGAKRIGRALCLALARAGWDVVVHYGRSQVEAEALVSEIQALGRRACAVQADLSVEQEVRGLMARAQAAIGAASAIRCLVNNASLFEYDNVTDFGFAALNAHMHANLAAPVMLTQALHGLTPDGQQSVAINLLDQKLFNLNPDFLSYTLSKAALHTATTMLAQALAPKMRVVGVAPGITLVSGDQSETGFAKAHTQTPLGRSSTPEDIASTVCFVAANPAITGTTLLVDGGQHLIPMTRDVMFVAQ